MLGSLLLQIYLRKFLTFALVTFQKGKQRNKQTNNIDQNKTPLTPFLTYINTREHCYWKPESWPGFQNCPSNPAMIPKRSVQPILGIGITPIANPEVTRCSAKKRNWGCSLQAFFGLSNSPSISFCCLCIYCTFYVFVMFDIVNKIELTFSRPGICKR